MIPSQIGIVNKIIPFSSVDGPGNRTAIFLQGCNFNCLYCHNPETINLCTNCGICVEVCPYGALAMEDSHVIWDEVSCQKCDKCLETCPNDSSPKTKAMSVEEVVSEIKKYKAFISGITVSGGEATLQTDFLIRLFREVKKLNLTIFIDSNGSYPFYENAELLELTDKVMLDCKSFSPSEHKRLTGSDNDVVIKNIKYLAEIDKLYEVRTVIVPEVLDNINNVDEISKLLAMLNPDIRYKLIKYRPLGVRLNMIDSYVPSDGMILELKAIAEANGCSNIVIV